MAKKFNHTENNNAVPCQVCGQLTYMDDYGNMDKCSNCGWIGCTQNTLMEKWRGISYPMLVPLSRAREQYKNGQKFKATFDDFINGLKFYKEMLFWHNGKNYKVVYCDDGIHLDSMEFGAIYKDVDDFIYNANIDGRLLKDIWDEVVHPCFMYCVEKESDYDFPPED